MNRQGLFCATLLLTCGAQAATPVVAAAPSAGPQYSFRVAANLSTLEARVCFDTTPPALLVLGHPTAARYLRGAALERADQKLPVRLTTRGLVLPAGRPGDCLRYVTRLADVAGVGAAAPRALLTSSADWLWRDVSTPPGTVLSVQFDLAPGMRLASPWETVSTAGTGTALAYRVRVPATALPDQLAIGELQTWRLTPPGADLQVAILTASGTTGSDAAQLQRSLVAPWLEEAAAAAATLRGRFPVATLAVLILPTPAGTASPVATRIAGGAQRTVSIAVDPGRSLPQLREDPTALNTFLRLLLPPLAPEAEWLGAGLARYGGDVARVRHGMMSIPEAWVRLQRGMLGEGDAWRGARLWLQADVDLRDASQGRQSLETALAAFARCCLATDRVWGDRELLLELDRLTGTRAFSTLLPGAGGASLPPVSALFDDLGVRITGDELEIDDGAPLACIRENIMQSRRLRNCAAPEKSR